MKQYREIENKKVNTHIPTCRDPKEALREAEMWFLSCGFISTSPSILRSYKGKMHIISQNTEASDYIYVAKIVDTVK